MDKTKGNETTITVEQVEAFCAAASSPSYRDAANALRQSGDGPDAHRWIIRLIDRLEEAIGTKLVEGTPRGEIHLTSAGLQLLPSALAFRDAAHALRNHSAAYRLTAYPAVALRLLQHEDGRRLFEGPEPLTLYDITESHRSDRGRSILNRTALAEIDLSIAPSGRARDLTTFRLHETLLYSWELHVVLGGGDDCSLGSRKSVRPRDLAMFKIVCSPSGHRSRELLEQAFGDEGVPFEPYLELSNQEVLRELAFEIDYVVAVLPDDSFGAAAQFGPRLATRKRSNYGDSYSLYRRHPFDSKQPTAREQRIAALAVEIRNVFDPVLAEKPSPDLAEELTLETRKRARKNLRPRPRRKSGRADDVGL